MINKTTLKILAGLTNYNSVKVHKDFKFSYKTLGNSIIYRPIFPPSLDTHSLYNIKSYNARYLLYV